MLFLQLLDMERVNVLPEEAKTAPIILIHCQLLGLSKKNPRNTESVFTDVQSCRKF
jgi:hypothetical protein